MKLNINPDWLVRMAEKGENKFISAGGLVVRMDAKNQPVAADGSRATSEELASLTIEGGREP